MLKWLAGAAGAFVLLLLAFAFFAHQPEIAPVAPPAATRRDAAYTKEEVAWGAALAEAGCRGCHTVPGGAPYAGGVGVAMPFGTIWSTNITPDPERGIGRWSEAAFRRALHEGVGRDGSHLYPAFPYTHFTHLSDGDVRALYAFLRTVPAVAQRNRANNLPFPLNVRAVLAVWKKAFFEEGRATPDPAHDAAWNRGAYLSDALLQCGRCHTAFDRYGVERDPYGGAVTGDWVAPALDARNPAPQPWDADELQRYLRTGASLRHGAALGPMAPVVRGMAGLPEEDVAAVARYFAWMAGQNADARTESDEPRTERAGGRLAAIEARLRRFSAHWGGGERTAGLGPQLYAGACAACHFQPDEGGAVTPFRPALGRSTALWLDQPDNFLQVVLFGTTVRDGAQGVVMPAFPGLGDDEIAALGNWLRGELTDRPPWPDLAAKVAAVRATRATLRTEEAAP